MRLRYLNLKLSESWLIKSLLRLFLMLAVAMSWSTQASVSIPAGASLSLGDGAVHLGCRDLSVNGLVNGDRGSLNLRHLTIGASGSLYAKSSRVEVSGNWTGSGRFISGNGLVLLKDGCGVNTATVSAQNTFYSLYITSSAGKIFKFSSGKTQTISNQLTVSGEVDTYLILSSSANTPAIFIIDGGQDIRYADTAGIEIQEGQAEDGMHHGLPVWLLWYASENKQS